MNERRIGLEKVNVSVEPAEDGRRPKLALEASTAMKRVMIVERRDLSSRATLEVQKRIAIGHRPSNLVNPRQIQMTFNGLSEGEAWLHRVQERCVPCPKAGREKVAHPV